MGYRRISDNPAVQRRYERLRRKGQSHAIAEMLALRQSPGAGPTNMSYWSEITLHPFDNDESGVIRDTFLIAHRAGINTHGKWYEPCLADSRGAADPEAWISGLDDAMAVAKKRNLDLHGRVRHRAVQKEPETKPRQVRRKKQKQNTPVPPPAIAPLSAHDRPAGAFSFHRRLKIALPSAGDGGA